ncbi:MAG: integral rane sensor signal transduction histidine kinase [Bryobacterales bacterium]|nr:integral rane sensor signal transduction histidine kinase [Bryobacterales bacterium]
MLDNLSHYDGLREILITMKRAMQHRFNNMYGSTLRRWFGPKTMRISSALLSAVLVVGAAGVAFGMRFNLSTAGSLELLLIVLIALRWGRFHATVASVFAVFCLNYLFIPPIFKLTVTEPGNWVSHLTFESTALLVGALSSKARINAARADLQRQRTAKLYELSRAILLLDWRNSTAAQLASLIREMVGVEWVDLWVIYDPAHTSTGDEAILSEDSAEQTYCEGKDSDDLDLRTSRRVLHLGTTPIGAMVLRGWDIDPLLADAVGSLAAIAFERARSLENEKRAEASRNIEQLRTAVLDGLAHAFKTPLTAIQTASSGLLAIGRMTETQTELVSIIDGEAGMLSKLATRLLQTAALEAKQVRLSRSKFSAVALIESLMQTQEQTARDRIELIAASPVILVEADAELIRLAVGQLLDNAVKYSKVDSKIQVSVVQGDVETLISVVNSGVAIGAEERDRVFERFYRGPDAVRGPAGTGLGLSIVKKIAEAHQGRTWVKCEGDKTSFVFAMPNHRGVSNG